MSTSVENDASLPVRRSMPKACSTLAVVAPPTIVPVRAASNENVPRAASDGQTVRDGNGAA